MLSGPIGWIQKGLVAFVSVVFSRGRVFLLNKIVSTVVDGTVEFKVSSLAYCMNQHCKCFLNASVFTVFFLHVGGVIDFFPSAAVCTAQAYVKTVVYPSDSAKNP